MAAYRFWIGAEGLSSLSAKCRAELDSLSRAHTTMGYLLHPDAGWYAVCWERPTLNAIVDRARVAVRVAVAGIALGDGIPFCAFDMEQTIAGIDMRGNARAALRAAPQKLAEIVRAWYAAHLTSYTLSGFVEVDSADGLGGTRV